MSAGHRTAVYARERLVAQSRRGPPAHIVRRALDGHHPQTATEIITWLEETVAGWNAEPTPFVWDGKRRKQHRRARHRRPAGAAALVDQPPNWRHDPLGGRVRLHRGDDAAVVVAAAGVEAPVRPGCRR